MNSSSRRFVRLGLLALGLAAALSVLAFRVPGVAQALSRPDLSPLMIPRELGSSLPFGVYDPHGAFKNERGIAIEHVFLPWQDVDLTSLHSVDSYAAARERDLLITLEPWSWSPERRIPRRALFDGIVNGRFDENIRRACRTISQLRSRVTVRWAHEMDDTSGRYTWSLWEPRDYISAYRHFVEACRGQASNARFMWAPKGEKLLNAFYPGDAYVDVIGLSIFGLQEYDIDKFGRNRSFEEVVRMTYDRVTSYKKPIYIAELGIRGDDEYMTAWWNGVRAADTTFPALRAIVYFNEVETYPWPEHYGRPDWRIRRDVGAEATQ